VTDIAEPTWDLVRDAIQGGRTDEALKIMEHRLTGNKSMHDRLLLHIDDILTHLASLGEEEIEKAFRKRYYPMVNNLLSKAPSVEEILQFFIEDHKNHYSDFTVVEEPERYVMRLDPCGSGGRLMRSKIVGRTQKAYPWSWSRGDVSYYCPHCCLAFEIIPIELRSYPIAIIECPKKPEAPCINYYYKKPELIPDKYFTRIGMIKTIR